MKGVNDLMIKANTVNLKILEKLNDGEKLTLKNQRVYIIVERIHRMTNPPFTKMLDCYDINSYRSGDAPRHYQLGLHETINVLPKLLNRRK